MPQRHDRHLHLDGSRLSLEQLERRRTLDASSCSPACEELIEVTRLDGAESFLVRADDPVYGVIDCGDEPGSDSDLYSFTLNSAAERPADTARQDEPGDDHDVYDFGQDRGPAIDDEAEYQVDAVELASPTDFSGAPVVAPVPVEVSPESAPAVESSEGTPVLALVPASSPIRWINGDATSPAASVTDDQTTTEQSVPATWTDLVALAEPILAPQPV
jgi:hypothetical protein